MFDKSEMERWGGLARREPCMVRFVLLAEVGK